MVRLTVDLIENSPQFMNPLKQRELDVRGNKLSMIENLGATEDQFDTIDVSDNEISVVGNFPQMKRLRSLLCNNNKVSRVDPNLGDSIPALESLILTNNRVTALGDLLVLVSLSELRNLSLIGNPVSKHPKYRMFVINLLPTLAVLDFTKVKEKERLAATKFFKSAAGTKLVAESTPSTEQEAAAAAGSMDVDSKPAAPKKPNAIMVNKIKAAIEAATSLEEIQRLEEHLRSGKLPAELM